MITRKEFEALDNIEITEPVITAHELRLKEGTLLYGTKDDLFLHVYKALGDTLHIVVYDSKNQLLGHRWGADLRVTDCAMMKNGKWAQPECSDYQMAALMRQRGGKIGFKNYHDVSDDSTIWFGAVANRTHTSDANVTVLTRDIMKFD